MSQLHQAVKILREDGARQLSKQTVSHLLTRSQRKIMDIYLSDKIVGNKELEEKYLNDSQVWYLESESLITYTSPDKKGAPRELNQYLTEYQPEKPFICELPSCTLFGPSAIGFSNQGDLILETAGGNRDFLYKRSNGFLGGSPIRNMVASAGPKQTTIQTASHVFPLVPVYNQYFYHWILIYLPKLRMLEYYEQNTGNRPMILVEDTPPSFVTETLSLLGYDDERLIEWKGGKQKVENLILTNYRIHSTGLSTYEQSLDDYFWLRNQLRSHVDSQQSSGKKIYISRQEAERGRKVANYNEVLEELESRGFDSVVMESLPIREQIRLISAADTIIGPHGAGLVNMIFAENPTVVELFPEDVIKPHFYMLADLLEFEYKSLVADTVNGNNLQIDVEDLCKLLDGDDV